MNLMLTGAGFFRACIKKEVDSIHGKYEIGTFVHFRYA